MSEHETWVGRGRVSSDHDLRRFAVSVGRGKPGTPAMTKAEDTAQFHDSGTINRKIGLHTGITTDSLKSLMNNH